MISKKYVSPKIIIKNKHDIPQILRLLMPIWVQINPLMNVYKQVIGFYDIIHYTLRSCLVASSSDSFP